LKGLSNVSRRTGETGCISGRSLGNGPHSALEIANVFFIKKKDGKHRFVQDYHALNLITQKNRYPLPLIDDLIHWLKGAKYFTKLDVHWGYNTMRIKDGYEWKAVFRTNRSLFELLWTDKQPRDLPNDDK
jgi:hypothetical protein